jgi:hypothetical protein
MLNKKSRFEIILVLLLSIFVLKGECGEVTQQKLLPLPFSQFENLYFEESRALFLARGGLVSRPPFLLSSQRGYDFSVVPRVQEEMTFPGTTLLLFEPKGLEGFIRHYFHFLEHLVGFWSFYGDQHFLDVTNIVIAGEGSGQLSFDKIRGPNDLNVHIVKALFPNAKMLSWNDFRAQCKGKTLRFERAVTSDRDFRLISPECTSINKLLGAARLELSQEALERFSEKVHSYAKTPPRKNDGKIHVTYVSRGSPRRLDFFARRRLISILRGMPQVSLQVVDLDTLSYKEQVNLIGQTDVLIGVHGNGLSHVLYLPKGACLIELFPKNICFLDYRLFANARGVDYYGFVEERGFVSDEEAYSHYRGGNPNYEIKLLDYKTIYEIIQLRR